MQKGRRTKVFLIFGAALFLVTSVPVTALMEPLPYKDNVMYIVRSLLLFRFEYIPMLFDKHRHTLISIISGVKSRAFLAELEPHICQIQPLVLLQHF